MVWTGQNKMKQEKLNFNAPVGERITPAKNSIYPFSKHQTDWAFVAFLERVCDRWDAERQEEQEEAQNAAHDEQQALINSMLEAQAERMKQLQKEATQEALQAIKSSGVVMRGEVEAERPKEAYTWKHNKPYRR